MMLKWRVRNRWEARQAQAAMVMLMASLYRPVRRSPPRKMAMFLHTQRLQKFETANSATIGVRNAPEADIGVYEDRTLR